MEEIKKIFSCSKNTAYAIMNTPGFPSFRIGRKVYVEAKELETWVTKNRHKSCK
ncbi:MAG: helix-turn-helix domain-containing protein [Bacteroidales bacterium]|nr:helix-turn-helix domain-containing protein [Bacteroidales bacterium]